MALDKTKTNGLLGREIRDCLRKQGVETPMKFNIMASSAPSIEESFRIIMLRLGLDLDDDSLIETPRRVSRMFINELFWGLDYDNFPKITTVANKMKYDEMVIERDIKIASTCEHHFVTIFGKAHIAYIPKSKVLGLSKLNRIAEFFAKRPQIQERLTEQIFYTLNYILDTEDIAVVIDAEHFCVKTRGVEDVNSSTITSKMGGCFKDSGARAEFLKLIGR